MVESLQFLKVLCMSQFFLKLLEHLNSSVFALMLLLIVAFWATYKVGQLIQAYRGHCRHYEDFEKRIDDRFEHVDLWFEQMDRKMNRRFEKIERDLSEVKATLKLLYEAFMKSLKS